MNDGRECKGYAEGVHATDAWNTHIYTSYATTHHGVIICTPCAVNEYVHTNLMDE